MDALRKSARGESALASHPRAWRSTHPRKSVKKSASNGAPSQGKLKEDAQRSSGDVRGPKKPNGSARAIPTRRT
jgi:hypothetical protein